MRKKVLALAGATGLFLGSALLTAPAASAVTRAEGSPARATLSLVGEGRSTGQVSSMGLARSAAAGSDYIAVLAPVSANQVTGSGEIWVTLTGDSAKFTLQVSGLLAGSPHAAHIYASGQCPTAEQTVEAGGHSSVSLASADLGSIGASLTTSGDTGASAALALTRYPTAGDYTYSRTFDVTPAVATAIRNGSAVLVVHGIDYNGNGRYDNVLGTALGQPAEATDPALCGAFVASQMVSTPSGSADTGGGSAAAESHPGLIALGLVALVGALATGVVAVRRRFATPSVEVVVTNGFRRMIR